MIGSRPFRREGGPVEFVAFGQQVEPATLEAFELLTLKEWPADKVAAQLGMSVTAVLKAKRRLRPLTHLSVTGD